MQTVFHNPATCCGYFQIINIVVIDQEQAVIFSSESRKNFLAGTALFAFFMVNFEFVHRSPLCQSFKPQFHHNFPALPATFNPAA
jgi:hypothetical protein